MKSKKIILCYLIVFLLSIPSITYAKTYSDFLTSKDNIVCIYKSATNVNYRDYINITLTPTKSGDILSYFELKSFSMDNTTNEEKEVYYYVHQEEESGADLFIEDIILNGNTTNTLGTGFALAGGSDSANPSWMRYLSDVLFNKNKDVLTEYDNGAMCPSTIWQLKLSKSGYKYIMCDKEIKGISNGNTTVDSCVVAEFNIANNQQMLINKDSLFYWTEYEGESYTYTKYTHDATYGFEADPETESSDYEDFKKDLEAQEAIYCDENNAEYDSEKCQEIRIALGWGEKANTYSSVPVVESPEIDLEALDCESLLGNPDTEGAPAWYLALMFKIVKYVAIIILIVMSIFDFVSAVASNDNDSIKKAVNKLTKRAIFCVIIFLLPTLLEFILRYVHEKAVSMCI